MEYALQSHTSVVDGYFMAQLSNIMIQHIDGYCVSFAYTLCRATRLMSLLCNE